jgi:hypothetical protein
MMERMSEIPVLVIFRIQFSRDKHLNGRRTDGWFAKQQRQTNAGKKRR